MPVQPAASSPSATVNTNGSAEELLILLLLLLQAFARRWVGLGMAQKWELGTGGGSNGGRNLFQTDSPVGKLRRLPANGKARCQIYCRATRLLKLKRTKSDPLAFESVELMTQQQKLVDSNSIRRQSTTG